MARTRVVRRGIVRWIDTNKAYKAPPETKKAVAVITDQVRYKVDLPLLEQLMRENTAENRKKAQPVIDKYYSRWKNKGVRVQWIRVLSDLHILTTIEIMAIERPYADVSSQEIAEETNAIFDTHYTKTKISLFLMTRGNPENTRKVNRCRNMRLLSQNLTQPPFVVIRLSEYVKDIYHDVYY